MKSTVIFAFLLLAGISGGAYYFYMPSYSLTIPDVKVAIQIPDQDEARPETYFTAEENGRLQDALRPYRHKIKKVKILLDHFHQSSPADDCASFQLIITTEEGCILQSKAITTSRTQLPSEIHAKIERSFVLFEQLSRTPTYEKRNLARISEI
ncbi:hypothetical protein [Oleidesulfovibrio sp.]|uniref:hypothetical protein n=1 Tax=Oleidesulfovibrio sp. TaxID=2909707 RepID=UPI003A8C76F9